MMRGVIFGLLLEVQMQVAVSDNMFDCSPPKSVAVSIVITRYLQGLRPALPKEPTKTCFEARQGMG